MALDFPFLEMPDRLLGANSLLAVPMILLGIENMIRIYQTVIPVIS